MFAIDQVIRENVPLSPLTTLGVGGPARYFLYARRREVAEAGVAWALERQLPIFVLGGGSNLVIADEGFPGLVLRVGMRGIAVQERGEAIALTVEAGEAWHSLVSRAVAENWAGMECLAGIPGLVGATPVQNVGAYGQEVREIITDVEAVDLRTREITVFANDACGFGYRDSRFKQAERGRYLILRVRYRLIPGGPPCVRYVELDRHLASLGITRPTLADVRLAVLDIRQRKSMLHNHRDPNAHSAGSFFVNPLMTADEFSTFEQIVAQQLAAGTRIPAFPTSDGLLKISAAWLIEQAGFPRGHSRGAVGLSQKHTLALVNYGGATARDIIALARDIRNRVYDQFGVLLVPEPTFVGVSLDEEAG